MGNRHHGFIKAIDGGIVLPVQGAVKLQLFFREGTELLGGNISDIDGWLRLGILGLCLLPWLRLRFTNWLQLSEKIIGKETRVGIVRIIGPTVGLYLFSWLRLRWLNRFRLWLRRLIRRNRLDNFLLGSPFQLRVFQLLTYSHTLTCPHKFGQIGVKSMMRETC